MQQKSLAERLVLFPHSGASVFSATLVLYDSKQHLAASGVYRMPLDWGHHKWFITVYGSEKVRATRVTHLTRPRADALLVRLGLALSRERVPFLAPGASLALPGSSASTWRRQMSTFGNGAFSPSASKKASDQTGSLTGAQLGMGAASRQNASATKTVTVSEAPVSASLLPLGTFGVRTEAPRFSCSSVSEARCDEEGARFCICVAPPQSTSVTISLQYKLSGGALRSAHRDALAPRESNADDEKNKPFPLSDRLDKARKLPRHHQECFTKQCSRTTTADYLLSVLPVKLHFAFEDTSSGKAEGDARPATGRYSGESLAEAPGPCAEGRGALLINSIDSPEPQAPHIPHGPPPSEQRVGGDWEALRWLGGVQKNMAVLSEGCSNVKGTPGCAESGWFEQLVAGVEELGYYESLHVTPYQCVPAGLSGRVSAIRVRTRVSLAHDGQDGTAVRFGRFDWTIEHHVDLLHVSQGDILVTAFEDLSMLSSKDRAARQTTMQQSPLTPAGRQPAVKGLQVSMEPFTCSKHEARPSVEYNGKRFDLGPGVTAPAQHLEKPMLWQVSRQEDNFGAATRAAHLALYRDLHEKNRAEEYGMEPLLPPLAPSPGFLSRAPLYRVIEGQLQRSGGGVRGIPVPRPTSMTNGDARRSCLTHFVSDGGANLTAAFALRSPAITVEQKIREPFGASTEPATGSGPRSSARSSGISHTSNAQSGFTRGSFKQPSGSARNRSAQSAMGTTQTRTRAAQPSTRTVLAPSSTSYHTWEGVLQNCLPSISARLTGRTLRQDLNSHLPPLHGRRYANRKKSLPSGSTVLAINGGWR